MIVLLWNNNGYGEIKTYMISRQIHPIGVDIFTPDFQMIGKGFGCEVVKLKNPGDLPGLMREATKRKTATIIEIDEDDYVANCRALIGAAQAPSGAIFAFWISIAWRAAAAASSPCATCTVGKANLMPLASNAFLIMA